MQLSVALQGIVTQTAAADGRRLRPRASPCEVLMPTPAIRNLIREGKTHQIYSVLQTSALSRHADDGRVAGRARPRRQDHPPARRAALDHPRGAPPPDRRHPVAAMIGEAVESMDDLRLQARSTSPASPPRGEVDARVQAGRHRPAQGARPDRPRHRGQEEARRRSRSSSCSGSRPRDLDDHDAPARDDGLVRHDDPPRAATCSRTRPSPSCSRRRSRRVRKDVEAGLPLSDALERHPKVFSPLYVAMVRAGETGGVLEDSLLRIADQLEKEDALRRQVRAAMMYPAVVISFALIVLLALVAFIVPIFAKVFKEFGGELPALTKFTVGVSHFVTGKWYLCIVGTVAIVWSFLAWKKSTWGRPQWDRFRLRVPMKIGDTVQKIALARWSRTFSALVSSGVPILQAIEITGQTAGNAARREGDGRRHRVGQARRHDRRPAQGGPRLPGDGRRHDRRRRGDRRPGHDAHEGRGLLRGPRSTRPSRPSPRSSSR